MKHGSSTQSHTVRAKRWSALPGRRTWEGITACTRASLQKPKRRSAIGATSSYASGSEGSQKARNAPPHPLAGFVLVAVIGKFP